MSSSILRTLATVLLSNLLSTEAMKHIDTYALRETASPFQSTVWPTLTNTNLYAIIGVNIGSFIFAIILLRIIWPPPSPQQMKQQKELEQAINKIQSDYATFNGHNNRQKTVIDVYEGESAGDYSEVWTSTFDLTFLIMMISFAVIICIWTSFVAPHLWTSTGFWIEQVSKFAVMCSVSCIGGLICRYFCNVDEKGYIITNKQSAFKVNYTRKLQHFAAYLVPLVLRIGAVTDVPGMNNFSIHELHNSC